MTRQNLFIGIDLGGTKISTALVDAAGKIMARDYRQTRAAEGQKAIVERMVDAAYRVMGEAGLVPAQIAAVGVGSPGPIDSRTGVVTAPPNLPGWKNVPLKQLIEEALGITTFLENDANAAALGEHRFGAGRGVQNMIYVTASTGIGGGLILNGQLYSGTTGAAGEIGHITVLPWGPYCGCGNRGCLEALASGTAIAREGRELVRRGMPTLITELAAGDPERVTAKLVAEAAAKGDIEAQEILAEAMTYLGVGMASLVNLFNPELIVIGGGLTNMGEKLFGPVRRAIERRAFPAAARAVKVVPAELGDDVGVLGAVAVAMAQVTSTLPALNLGRG
ncbi:MAG TPA: ROK family protein [Anaerolineae bacterium]|nr:ROK family protein [Anaerolineae bacterium]